MRRYQLVEIEDEAWCPRVLRDAATDYLQCVVELGQPYRELAPLLAGALSRSGARCIVDLCSGGGGPWRSLRGAVAGGAEPLEVQLTDKYPNTHARNRVDRVDGLSYRHEIVDATAVPPALDGFRTLFSSFHHFPPDEARAILSDAVRQRQGIAIAELTERTLGTLLLILASPLLVWLVTPAIRPFRWSRLLVTYVVPLVPLLALFDGVVSCLRTYSVDELRSMVGGLDAPGYTWEIGQVASLLGPGPITYLIGCPPPARGSRENDA